MPSRIHHTVSFKAAPPAVYDCLTNARTFASVTGAPAEIDATDGGAVSLFGAQIEGRNVELVENSRVVQAWRVAGWEPGLYSLVRFELRADGEGTELTFDHTGFPEDSFEDLDGGWTAMYWDPITKHLS